MASEGQDQALAAALQRKVEEHGQRKRPVANETSSLHRDVFDACDPLVERALADAAMKVFRRHMMGDEHAVPEILPQGESREEKVPVEEVRAAAAELCAIPDAAPPDLHANLGPERMWILLDMSKHSFGLARQRATAELREMLGRVDIVENVGAAVLDTLVRVLDQARSQPGAPLVLQALHGSAERALRATTGPTP